MDVDNSILPALKRTPWNKGKLIGAKPPLLGKARLVHSHEASNRKASSRIGNVQSRN
jgi:hypothetical protein